MDMAIQATSHRSWRFRRKDELLSETFKTRNDVPEPVPMLSVLEAAETIGRLYRLPWLGSGNMRLIVRVVDVTHAPHRWDARVVPADERLGEGEARVYLSSLEGPLDEAN